MGNKTFGRGSDAQLLAAFEATYGVAPANFQKLQFKDTDISEEKGLGSDQLLGAGRDPSDPFYNRPDVMGGLGIPFDLQGTGFWLKGLMGDPNTTDNGDGTYTHVFTPGSAVPSLHLEVGHPELSTPQFFVFAGLKLDTLSFDMTDQGPANAQMTAIAQSEVRNAATIDAAPDSYSLTRFNQSRGSMMLGGSQLNAVTGGSLQYANGLEGIKTIREDGKIDAVDEGEVALNGSMTIRHTTDLTLITAAEDETPVALEYKFTIAGSEGYNLTFAIPRAFVMKPKKSIPGPGGIEMTFDWQAAKDDVAGHAIEVTLKNDVASY